MMTGVPSTLYHGTSTSFSEFSISECGSKNGTGYPLGFLGIYFTECPVLASKFCKNKWSSSRSKYKKGSHVIPVNLVADSIKVMNPIEWIRYSGSPKEELISLRKDLISQGYDCIRVESSAVHCVDELYVAQYIALKPEIIKYKIAL